MNATVSVVVEPMRLEDIQFKKYEARRVIETCGVVTVEKKGNVVSDKVHCGGMIIRGKIKGHISSRGPVLVGPEAEIKGDVTAPTIARLRSGQRNSPPEGHETNATARNVAVPVR